MTLDIKPILNAGVAAQAASLSFYNLKSMNKRWMYQKPRSELIKKGMGNIIGVSLIQTQSQLI